MSCTRRGFLKTLGAAMVGLGLTRLEPLRAFAASSVSAAGERLAGGPVSGPYSVDSLRAWAVQTAHWLGDEPLADYLWEVCCWAPAAAAIRERPLGVQWRGARRFFQDFPGGDQLAQIMLYTNNTSWRTPRFRFDAERLVAAHYRLQDRSPGDVRTEVLSPTHLDGVGTRGNLGLVLDRETGERLAKAADRAEPMWAALSVFAGMLLDPTDDLTRRLLPRLSFYRTGDRSLARLAAIRYNQIVIGAAQRAVWSDLLDEANPALPLLQLSAAGYLPLGEEGRRFILLRVGGRGRALGRS